MHIDTIRFPGVIDRLEESGCFFSRTVFVISHKNESLETLLSVLWYLPVSSQIVVVTNCPLEDLPSLTDGLQQVSRDNIFLIHQKDERIASYFRKQGVSNLLGTDGLVIDGKGEGMYIGALCAALLGENACEWVVFYDADNFVPCALIEYTLAMARLFLAARSQGEAGPTFHNVRICWSSKPFLDGGEIRTHVLGRCTRVVSPLASLLFTEVCGSSAAILTSNAGEQALTVRTVRALRFSSRYSIETFQLLDLFARGVNRRDSRTLFQQYQAQSPHFHEKGDETHIRGMIAESLGCFPLFADLIPLRVEQEILRVCSGLSISPRLPRVYPALDELCIQADPDFLQNFLLSRAGVQPNEPDANQITSRA